MAMGQQLSAEVEGELPFYRDRGSQHAAHDYQEQLLDWSIVGNMSRKGNCRENAVIESFLATLKKEKVHQKHYLAREQAKASLFY